MGTERGSSTVSASSSTSYTAPSRRPWAPTPGSSSSRSSPPSGLRWSSSWPSRKPTGWAVAAWAASTCCWACSSRVKASPPTGSMTWAPVSRRCKPRSSGPAAVAGATRPRLVPVPQFQLTSDFSPAGDQPGAIAGLLESLRQGNREQTLMGVTGSGKTFTVAHVINELKRPTLVLSPNKTLAAQLWAEFREFFPQNAVEFFVSYYDYYQPEAYIARTDTYIEKDSSRNEEIDRLRNSATRALLTRRDVIVVASVSCIYGIGSPENYLGESIRLHVGESWRRDILLRKLSDLQYVRNDTDFGRSRFRVRGDVLDIQPAYEELALRIELLGDEIESIRELDPLTGEIVAQRDTVTIFPASHYVTPADQMKLAVARIEAELEERAADLEQRGRLLEAQRLRQRTGFDLEMMRETGTCAGIENYSRHLRSEERRVGKEG